jgi:hypothetical protein
MQQTLEGEWYLVRVHENWEYHHLSRDDLLDLLRQEWARDFSAFLVGRDVECVGILEVFFLADMAYVSYVGFDGNRWLASTSPDPADPEQDEMVRLSPVDHEDFSFPRRFLVPKVEAWRVIQEYVSSLRVINLRDEDRPR